MKSTPKRYRDTRSVQFQGNVYDVECYIYPGEIETRDYPGSGDDIELISIFCNDEDIMDSLTIGEITTLENLALGL
jgi:hypothetical protein